MAYATLAELKAHLGGFQAANTESDTMLAAALASSIEAVDDFCGRSFNAAGSSTTRIFEGGTRRVLIDDAATVTVVEQSYDRVGWSARTDYWLDPPNTTPKTTIASRCYFGTWVRVTGTWGYGSTPASVKTATLLLAAKLYKRKDSPNGVEGSAEFGIRVSRFEDPDVVRLLTPHMRADSALGIA